jgi:phosphatidate cytidylyltransferase
VSASRRERTRFRDQALAARVASGVFLAVIALAGVWLGGWIFFALLTLFLLTGLWEFYRMAARAGLRPLPLPGLAAGAALVMLAKLHDPGIAGLVFTGLGLWMLVNTLRPPIEGRLVGLAVTVLGLAYVVGLGIHLLWLRELGDGLHLLALTLLATWSADTFAFFVGVRFGRRRLAPHISPGKSVEGLIGGIAGTVAVTAIAARFLAPALTLPESLFTGLVLSIAAPVGDLLESLMKRNLNAKDASRFIPGHGGVLDRIDSLLVTGAVAYYLLRYFLAGAPV